MTVAEERELARAILSDPVCEDCIAMNEALEHAEEVARERAEQIDVLEGNRLATLMVGMLYGLLVAIAVYWFARLA